MGPKYLGYPKQRHDHNLTKLTYFRDPYSSSGGSARSCMNPKPEHGVRRVGVRGGHITKRKSAFNKRGYRTLPLPNLDFLSPGPKHSLKTY